MLEFLSDNLATIIVAAVVFAAVALVLVKLIRDKKNHKSSCSCGCSGCPSSSICHKDR
ncbi:MAG: FeoB-associated Cys-rich membrane protein [Oscillospiraceae bacterium]